jgi:hypothetical protein
MKADSQLEQIWLTYRTTMDSLKVAKKTIKSGELRLLTETRFAGRAVEESTAWLQDSQTASEDFVILSLWVAFERVVIGYIQDKGSKIREQYPTWFSRGLYDKYENEVERWKIDEVLDLFKSGINPALIGNAKNIKKYRDWVAHRNPGKATPANVTPDFAYRILSELEESIESLTSDNLKALENRG